MITAQVCPECGGSVAADAPLGVCPKCVMNVMFGGGGAAPTAAHAGAGAAVPGLEVLEPIGRGGMGVVYRARQEKLDRPVALKLIRPDSTGLPGFAGRFAREARAMARLNHPNIVAVYDFGEADGLYYLVMELVEGGDLRRLVERGRMAPARAVGIALQVGEALRYAHEQGVIHRDIKPENVLIDGRGWVKLVDFGLAKLLLPDSAGGPLTETRHVIGTPRYMAPEQMERPREVDQRADVYALGVLLYEMIMGRPPLGRFELPSESVEVDEDFDSIVTKALAHDPADRYATVAAMLADLEEYAENNFDPDEFGAHTPALARSTDHDEDEEGEADEEDLEDEDDGEEDWFDRTFETVARLAFYLFLLAIPVGMAWGVGKAFIERVVDELYGAAGAINHAFSRDPGAGLLTAFILCVPVQVGLVVWLRRRRPGRAVEPPTVESSPAEDASARRALRGPAIGLTLVGLIDCLSIVAAVVFMVDLLRSPLWNRLTLGEIALIAALPAVVLGSIGGLVLLAALNMGERRAYRLAVAGAVLAMLPLAPGFVLGLPLGVWALAVLTRPAVRRAFGRPEGIDEEASEPAPPADDDARAALAAARAAVRGPAIGMAAVGALTFLFGVLVVFLVPVGVWADAAAPTAVQGSFTGLTIMLVGAAKVVVLGILITLGGLATLDLRSRPVAFGAAVLTLFSPLFFLGVPVGVWALLALTRPEVAAALIRARASRPAPKPEGVHLSAIAGARTPGPHLP